MVLSNKGRLGVLFGANVLGLMVMLVGQLNGSGIVPMLVILATCCYFIVFRSSGDEPVSVHLATLVCMDLCAYVALNYQILSEAFMGEAFSWAINNLGEFYGLMLVGLLLFTIGILRVPWLLGVGGGCLGVALILGLFGEGSLDHIEFILHGQTVVAIYILCAAFWTVCLFMSSSAKNRSAKNTDPQFVVLAFLSLAVSMYVVIGCAAFADVRAGSCIPMILALPDEAFSWWRVLVCCVVLLGLAYVFGSTYSIDNQMYWGIDSIIMVAWAVLVIGIRVLMNHYFMFSWVLYLVFAIAVCRCVGNATRGKQTLKLAPQRFLAVALIFIIVFANMLGSGLVPSVIVTGVLALVAYVQLGRIRPKTSRVEVFVVVAFTAEAIAWLGKRYNCIESYYMLGMILVFSVAALAIINRRHVSKSRMQLNVSIGICICVALLCCLSLRTSVEVRVKNVENDAILTILAKRESNPAKRVTYEWKDAFGQTVTKKSIKIKRKKKLSVKSDHLVVQVTDSFGVTETYDYYYAPWMHDFDASN